MSAHPPNPERIRQLVAGFREAISEEHTHAEAIAAASALLATAAVEAGVGIAELHITLHRAHELAAVAAAQRDVRRILTRSAVAELRQMGQHTLCRSGCGRLDGQP